MKKVTLIFFFLFSSVTYAQIINSDQDFERDFLIKFDGICVQNIDSLDRIKSYASNQKWIILPDEQSALIKPKIIGSGYAAWGFVEKSKAFMIGVNDADKANTCTIATKYENLNKFKKYLNEFYKLQLMESKKQGIQTYEIYKLNMLSNKKTWIFLTYSYELNYEFISISILQDI